MKRLSDLLDEVEVIQIIGASDRIIDQLCQDSRLVEPGSAFVAWEGRHVDGHAYIDQAIARGADAVICEQMPSIIADDVTYVHVRDARRAIARMAAAFYGHPDRAMFMIGITGTNGKTTVAVLAHQLMHALGRPTGLMSTIHVVYEDEVWPATHTTPDVIQLYARWADMLAMGCEAICMEVSSHALDQDRCYGVDFDVAVFTNITRDHLDYHGDFRAYLDAKKKLFDELKPEARAIINADDRHADYMVQNCDAQVSTFGLQGFGDYHGRLVESRIDGMVMQLDGYELGFRLTGDYNASNLLAVYGAVHAAGYQQMDVLPHWTALRAARGRFEMVDNDRGIWAIVDYAHTPDAVTNVLRNVRLLVKEGSIITVIGCGGDRDKGKRPLMAKAAAELSDTLVLTSDNPRSEDPESIIDDMMNGLDASTHRSVFRMTRREDAIKLACQLAQPQDLILVAGKGHETYQDIKGERYPFNDIEVLRRYLS